MNEMDVEELHKLLEADFDVGLLYWKDSGTRKKGSGVAGSKTSDGYYQVCVNNKVYRLHRVLWCLYYKSWPTEYIDHIDRNKSNNSITNLREASAQQNAFNRNHTKSNKSGYRGVATSGDKFKAELRIEDKVVYLGSYRTPEEASIVVEAKAKEIHGEFYVDPVYSYDKSIVPTKIEVNSIAKGVDKRGEKYRARITIKGTKVHLGTFDTLEEASAAFEAAKLERDANK